MTPNKGSTRKAERVIAGTIKPKKPDVPSGDGLWKWSVLSGDGFWKEEMFERSSESGIIN